MSKELQDILDLISHYGLVSKRAGQNPGDAGYEEVKAETYIWLERRVGQLFNLNVEMLEMLKVCMDYWNHKADKDDMYEVKEKYDNLIACLQKEVNRWINFGK